MHIEKVSNKCSSERISNDLIEGLSKIFHHFNSSLKYCCPVIYIKNLMHHFNQKFPQMYDSEKPVLMFHHKASRNVFMETLVFTFWCKFVLLLLLLLVCFYFVLHKQKKILVSCKILMDLHALGCPDHDLTISRKCLSVRLSNV